MEYSYNGGQYGYVPIDATGHYTTPFLPFGNYSLRVCAVPVLCGYGNADLQQTNAPLNLKLHQ